MFKVLREDKELLLVILQHKVVEERRVDKVLREDKVFREKVVKL